MKPHAAPNRSELSCIAINSCANSGRQDARPPRQAGCLTLSALRNLAVSRIYLDNFDHITAYWMRLGLKLAQVAQSYGATV
jgi:2-iminoacetate synthase ThiH